MILSLHRHILLHCCHYPYSSQVFALNSSDNSVHSQSNPQLHPIIPPSASSPFLMAAAASLTLLQTPLINGHMCLAAEMDADTRSVVSKLKGWPSDGSIWSFDKRGAHTFYAKDVWTLIMDSCLLLRQFLALLPPDAAIFSGAGSPCQDLTSIGRGQGVLGLTGGRSVHIHCVWAVLYFPSHTKFWQRTVNLVENAGSMQPHMKTFIHNILGIPASCCHHINCSKWGSVTRARLFFTSSDVDANLPSHSPSPFNPGWSPMLKVSTSQPPTFVPIPLPPWLRPRYYTPGAQLFNLLLHIIPRTCCTTFPSLALGKHSVNLAYLINLTFTPTSLLNASYPNFFGLNGTRCLLGRLWAHPCVTATS